MPLKPRKKTARVKSARTSRPARAGKSTPLSREMGVGAAALGVLALVVLIVAVAARPHPRDEAAVDQPSRSASAALIEEATKTPVPEAPASTDSESKEIGVVTAPVTITGCLERSDDAFRLKDTEGDDAPRARSWKSAFLKKGAAPVQVVDTANRLGLQSHVGERVTVTGTLIDREIRVRSLHRVAVSCSAKTRV